MGNPARTAAYNLSMGGTTGTNSQSSVNQRYLIRPTVRMKRWRIKLANYDTKNGVLGTAFTGAAIYVGTGAVDGGNEPNGNFSTATPTALVTSSFAIPGDGTYYVSPWFDAPMEAGTHYVISVGFSAGSAAAIVRGCNMGVAGVVAGAHARAGEQTPNFSRFSFSFLDAVIEYETHAAGVGLFIGDSLTECFGGDASLGMQSYMAWAQVAAGSRTQAAVVNAITGSQTSNWTSGTGNKWSRIDIATYRPNYAVVELGSNDASGSIALATFQANMTTIVTNLRNLGISRIYLATVMPRSFAAGPEAVRQSYNTWLRTAPMGVDGVFDFDAAVRDPAAQDTILAAYRFSDNIHLNRAGYAALAPLMTA